MPKTRVRNGNLGYEFVLRDCKNRMHVYAGKHVAMRTIRQAMQMSK
jgi:hypothetical protein